MKKLLAKLLCCLMVSLSSTSVFALPMEAPDIKIYLNNTSVYLNSPLLMQDGKSYLPLREALKQFPAEHQTSLSWDAKNQSVLLTIVSKPNDQKNTIKFFINQNYLILNALKLPLAEAPLLYKGKTYVHLRSMATLMGFNVLWDARNARIQIHPK